MFDFIENKEFRDILERDFEEIQMCMDNKASKAVLVLSGSIIEAILLEYFLLNPPRNLTKNKILKLKLYELIDEALQNGLISQKIKDLSSVVRGYRNFIHPSKEFRTKDFIDEESATISFSLLKMIINEIRKNYTERYGYKAVEIFKKITSDSSASSIFDKLLNKTNEGERRKLLNLLVAYYYQDSSKSGHRNFVIKYFDKLFNYLSEEIITYYIKELEKEVIQGEKEKALILFDLFGNKLEKIHIESQETIINYMYSVVGVANPFGDDLLLFTEKNIYRYLSLYNTKEGNKLKYLKIIVSIAKYLKSKKGQEWFYIDLYKNMTKGINEDAMKKYLKENIDMDNYEFFIDALENGDFLPF